MVSCFSIFLLKKTTKLATQASGATLYASMVLPPEGGSMLQGAKASEANTTLL